MKRFFIVFSIIFIIVVSILTGYFLLDKSGTKLSNNSTSIESSNWKILIEMGQKDLSLSTINSMDIDKTSIKIMGHMEGENSIVKYDLEIKNTGSIDAYLYSILNTNDKIDVKILVKNEELKSGTILKKGEVISASLVIKSKVNENFDFSDTIKLIFNQYNN
mgnify:CR=1 FL=1